MSKLKRKKSSRNIDDISKGNTILEQNDELSNNNISSRYYQGNNKPQGGLEDTAPQDKIVDGEYHRCGQMSRRELSVQFWKTVSNQLREDKAF